MIDLFQILQHLPIILITNIGDYVANSCIRHEILSDDINIVIRENLINTSHYARNIVVNVDKPMCGTDSWQL